MLKRCVFEVFQVVSAWWQAGKNGLDEATGKEFVQKLLGTIIEALKDEDLQVIISTGGQEEGSLA